MHALSCCACRTGPSLCCSSDGIPTRAARAFSRGQCCNRKLFRRYFPSHTPKDLSWQEEKISKKKKLKTKTNKNDVHLTSGLPSIPANCHQFSYWGNPAGPNFSDLHDLEPTAITGACGGKFRRLAVTIRKNQGFFSMCLFLTAQCESGSGTTSAKDTVALATINNRNSC